MPQSIDLLLVEQEFVGDDRPAVEAVVSADEKLFKIEKRGPSCSRVLKMDGGVDKVNDLHERLKMMGSDKAEPRASNILVG